ncbi:phosphotransferase-like protein [Arthrobacter cryoconiti]|uniref:Uncharacterized protein n=1 Tax=Arthrobacter cryoconiti TaxID=748907 RepID=A0ABV8R313_9MICC|nr:hypothetical protein [Arthrobacter cryoconiti]MCC9068497.1 hypothetical protein [Arthrobacter cryoconiti]
MTDTVSYPVGAPQRVEERALQQSQSVHAGVVYDVEADTTFHTTDGRARVVANQLTVDTWSP